MSGQLRIGILGAARITARALLAPARALSADSGPSADAVTVAAVAARDGSRAAAYAARHEIGASFSSYEELLDSPDLDAVYIPLPNGLHAPWTLRAIAAGKHVLCEKPFASNAVEARQVAAAAAASGLVVMEAMHYRYHPLVRRMAALISDGAIGVPVHAQAWTSWAVGNPADIRYDYAVGGGALMDGGCYAIDCLRLAGAAAGAAEPVIAGALASPMHEDGRVDRTCAARLDFPGGSGGDAAGSGGNAAGSGGLTGWFESAFTRDGEFRADVHVIGDAGHLWLRNFINAQEGLLQVTRDEEVVSQQHAAQLRAPGSDLDGDTTFCWQLRAFAAAVRDGAPFPTTADSAVITMGLIDDAYQAAGLPARGA